MVQRVFFILIFTLGGILNAWSNPLLPVESSFGEDTLHAVTLSDGAQAALVRTISLGDMGYSRDETLQGISATRSYSLNWPDAWEPQPISSFTVNFSHSPSLKAYSSLAVDWNGIRLGSILLTPESAEGGSLTVNIPDNLIETGYNRLRIVLYMGINDDRCVDPNNPAIWATIHNSSFFELAYSEKPVEVDLGLYPLPFMDNSGLIQNLVQFVVPDQPTEAELNAVALISAKLGQLATWRTISIDTQTESSATEDEFTDRIYIGAAGRLTIHNDTLPIISTSGNSISLQTEAGNPIAPEAGVLYLRPSQANPNTAELFVTGVDDNAMLIAAHALASENTFTRLHGPLGVVLSVPEPEEETDPFRQKITFSELGYQDETASGTRTQTLNYIIPLPMQWQVLTEAGLDLHFAHSQLLDGRRSSLTVSVNNSPIGSLLLNEESANDGHATFTIPARMLTVGENKISITTNIELVDGFEDEFECDDEHITEAWVVIYSDSTFNLPDGPASMSLSLADFPFAFIGRPDLADLAFILPDQPGAEIIDGLAQIAGQIGRSAEGQNLFPHVAFASHEDADTQWPYQVLIGRPTENSAITALNDTLPLPFEDGSDLPKPLDQVARLDEPNQNSGYVQAVLLDDGKPRLIATGSDPNAVAWATAALSSPELMRDLDGDLAIVDSDGTVTTASINESAIRAEAPDTEIETPSPTRWVAWLAGGLFMAAILILLTIAAADILNRRKARKSYEPPSL